MIDAEWRGQQLRGNAHGTQLPYEIKGFIFYIEPIVDWSHENHNTQHRSV